MTLANDNVYPADADLVARAYLRHRPELLRFLHSRLRCATAAEDAVQEVYLRASRATPPIRNPKALLFETAANLIRNLVRADGRRAAFSAYADLVSPPDNPLTPERSLLDVEALRRAKAIIDDLPPQCAEVFRLHRFEGLTQREVAQRLGVSTTAVEKSMRRAMARLAAAVSDA